MSRHYKETEKGIYAKWHSQTTFFYAVTDGKDNSGTCWLHTRFSLIFLARANGWGRITALAACASYCNLLCSLDRFVSIQDVHIFANLLGFLDWGSLQLFRNCGAGAPRCLLHPIVVQEGMLHPGQGLPRQRKSIFAEACGGTRPAARALGDTRTTTWWIFFFTVKSIVPGNCGDGLGALPVENVILPVIRGLLLLYHPMVTSRVENYELLRLRNQEPVRWAIRTRWWHRATLAAGVSLGETAG